MPPTLSSPAWILCRSLTPVSGRGWSNKATDVGSGLRTPARGTGESAEWSTGNFGTSRLTASRGVRSMVRSLMGLNWTISATTPTPAPVANVSTGLASTRITSEPLRTPTTGDGLSKTGVRPVMSTQLKPATSMQLQAAERVGPAEPQRGLRRKNALASVRPRGLVPARWAALGGDPSRSGWASLTFPAVKKEGE